MASEEPMKIKYDVKDSHIVDGVRYCAINKSEYLQRIKSFDVYTDDVYLCGYIKSGNTRLATIIKAIYHQHDLAGFQNEKLVVGDYHLDANFSCAAVQAKPRFFWTHLQYQHLPKDLSSKRTKVIYLMRSPKDVAVSYFNFHRISLLTGPWVGSWENFLDAFLSGNTVYGSWFDHTRSYWVHKDDSNILFIKYEDLRENCKYWIQEIATFLGKPLERDQLVDQLVEILDFKSMKANPNLSNDEHPTLVPGSSFLRKGIVGDWRTIFTEEQSRKVDELLRALCEETGCTFYIE